MKKLCSLLLLVMILSLFGCANEQRANQVKPQTKDTIEIVAGVVEKFGDNLQKVSLLGPKEELEKSMQENYGDVVSASLIEQWLTDPLKAPGRLTSSPWPDRIDIKTTEKLSEQAYAVDGEVIERTNTDETVNKIPIGLVVEKVGEDWLITEVTFSNAEQSDSIVYKNMKYEFDFTLPATWKGYSIEMDEWEGLTVSQEQTEKGPMILIRHPEWTAENPRQDIPIMIFTIAQWDALQQEKFHIGAAPIQPTELNRNEKFVFALPARYNYAFPKGYEEVEQILEGKPLTVHGD